MAENFTTLREETEKEVYSRPVRAGRRTYFFDVKQTRNEELYLSVTESVKKLGRDGETRHDKHTILVYKEDFTKFADGFSDALAYLKRHQPAEERRFDNSPKNSRLSIDEEFENL